MSIVMKKHNLRKISRNKNKTNDIKQEMHDDFSKRTTHLNSESDNFSQQINILEEDMLKELNDARNRIVDLELTQKSDVERINENYHKKIEFNNEEAVKKEIELKHSINAQLSQIETNKVINEERVRTKNEIKNEITNNIKKESDLQDQIKELEDELINLRMSKLNKEAVHQEQLHQFKLKKSQLINNYVTKKTELDGFIAKLSEELSNQQKLSIDNELKLNSEIVNNKTDQNNKNNEYAKVENSLNLKLDINQTSNEYLTAMNEALNQNIT